MMKFYFHEKAEKEFEKAISYYEKCKSGLGMDFANEVYTAINFAAQFPEAWSLISNNTRRCLVNRFPYGVIYRTKGGYLEIIAVADLRHKPDFWIDR